MRDAHLVGASRRRNITTTRRDLEHRPANDLVRRIFPRFSYRGEYVVKTLKLACKTIGYPTAIRGDQGSEFISRDLDL